MGPEWEKGERAKLPAITREAWGHRNARIAERKIEQRKSRIPLVNTFDMERSLMGLKQVKAGLSRIDVLKGL